MATDGWKVFCSSVGTGSPKCVHDFIHPPHQNLVTSVSSSRALDNRSLQCTEAQNGYHREPQVALELTDDQKEEDAAILLE